MQIIKGITHEQWLEERHNGIGASEIGTLMGANPYDTPYRLWRRKLRMDPPEEENEAMWVGHHIEQMSAERFSFLTGAVIKKGTQGDWLAVDEARPYLRVSPDRLYWSEGDAHTKKNLRILEIKSTRKHVDRDDIPLSWYLQLQYQMGVMGIRRGAVGWWTSQHDGPGAFHFDYTDVDFDEAVYGQICETISDFWLNHIVPRREPAPQTVEDVGIMYPSTKGFTITATDDVLEIWNALRTAKGDIEEAKGRASLYETQLKAAIGEAETLLSGDGQRLATWKMSKGRSSFNLELFKEEHPELAQRYITEGKPYRTLRLIA